MSNPSCCLVDCSKSCKEEFQIRNFCPVNYQPRLFVLSQCGPKLLYPIWTVFSAIYHVVWLILDMSLFNKKADYFIYFTNWGYSLLVITNLWNCFATCYVHFRRFDITEAEYESMTWYLKVLWVLFNVTNSVAIVITITYFAFLSPDDNPGSIEKHAFNSAYVLINLCISAMPIRILHFYQPAVFGIIYLLFSAVYQLGFGGDAIYSFLDWTNVNATLLMIIVSMILVHIFFYFIYKLRVYIAYKCCKDSLRSIERDDSGKLELQLYF